MNWTALAVACSASTALGAVNPHLLRYDKPAVKWEEALPVGNGRLGAMVFGQPAAERLQLNEATLWAGGPYDPVNPEAKEALPQVRQLVNEGKYREAARLISAIVMAKPLAQMPTDVRIQRFAEVCAGPTMDMQILRDLFAHTIQAATTLGVDEELRRQLAAARSRVAPNQVGRAGQLQEWIEDWDMEAGDIHHRHVSHLYGLYPGRHIHRRDTPALAAAVRSLNGGSAQLRYGSLTREAKLAKGKTYRWNGQ